MYSHFEFVVINKKSIFITHSFQLRVQDIKILIIRLKPSSNNSIWHHTLTGKWHDGESGHCTAY